MDGDGLWDRNLELEREGEYGKGGRKLEVGYRSGWDNARIFDKGGAVTK